MFNKNFNAVAKHPELDFASEDLQEAMEEIDELVYPNINDVHGAMSQPAAEL